MKLSPSGYLKQMAVIRDYNGLMPDTLTDGEIKETPGEPDGNQCGIGLVNRTILVCS